MKQTKPILFAVLAAALYALNSPFSKILLTGLSPTMLAALLYLGGVWECLPSDSSKKGQARQERKNH